MKKFFIGLFVGLIAIFGSIASVGSKSSFNNFNEFKTVKNAYTIDFNNNTLNIYFDNNLQIDENTYNQPITLDLIKLIGGQGTEFTINVWNEDNTLVEVLNTTYDLPFDNEFLKFYYQPNSYMGFSLTTEDLFVEKYFNTNTSWIYNTNLTYDNEIAINGFQFIWHFGSQGEATVDEDNLNELTPYIGNLTSLPSEEPIPPPDIGSMESSIGNVIRGIIDWFVDIFNGLADVFVIYDSTGQFIGFSVWGQVLFIEVGIGLVMIVLRWVISLIRGI